MVSSFQKERERAHFRSERMEVICLTPALVVASTTVRRSVAVMLVVVFFLDARPIRKKCCRVFIVLQIAVLSLPQLLCQTKEMFHMLKHIPDLTAHQ